jgi:hypothetical protein
VSSYEDAQITALKIGVFAVAAIAAASLLVTTRLPTSADEDASVAEQGDPNSS